MLSSWGAVPLKGRRLLHSSPRPKDKTPAGPGSVLPPQGAVGPASFPAGTLALMGHPRASSLPVVNHARLIEADTGLLVAAATGPGALAEMMHYALLYMQDGPIRVEFKEKLRARKWTLAFEVKTTRTHDRRKTETSPPHDGATP